MTNERRLIMVWAAWIFGLLTILGGIWALAAPASFFRDLATFAPYNRHFIHDVGAFQIGAGATLLAAAAGWDGLVVGLFGFAVGSVLHEASHVMDRHIGGHSTDPIGLGAVALLSVAVAGLAWWSRPVARHTSIGA
jgi:hypothetical protein